MDMSAHVNNAGHQLIRHGLHFHKNNRVDKQKATDETNYRQPIPNHRLFGNVGPWASMDFSKGKNDLVKLF